MATSTHFDDVELQCPCCGRNDVTEEFLERLEALRDLMGLPLYVSSGYRCPLYNDGISNTGLNGPHTTGQAADIIISYHHAFKLAKYAFELGFTGIGINQRGTPQDRFIHLDTLRANRPRIWTY